MDIFNLFLIYLFDLLFIFLFFLDPFLDLYDAAVKRVGGGGRKRKSAKMKKASEFGA